MNLRQLRGDFRDEPRLGALLRGSLCAAPRRGTATKMMIDYHDVGNVGEIYREGLDGAGNRHVSNRRRIFRRRQEVLKDHRRHQTETETRRGQIGETPNQSGRLVENLEARSLERCPLQVPGKPAHNHDVDQRHENHRIYERQEVRGPSWGSRAPGPSRFTVAPAPGRKEPKSASETCR